MKKKCIIIAVGFSILLMSVMGFSQNNKDNALKINPLPNFNQNKILGNELSKSQQYLLKNNNLLPNNNSELATRDLLFRESDRANLVTRDLLYRPDADGKLSTIKINEASELDKLIELNKQNQSKIFNTIKKQIPIPQTPITISK